MYPKASKLYIAPAGPDHWSEESPRTAAGRNPPRITTTIGASTKAARPIEIALAIQRLARGGTATERLEPDASRVVDAERQHEKDHRHGRRGMRVGRKGEVRHEGLERQHREVAGAQDQDHAEGAQR